MQSLHPRRAGRLFATLALLIALTLLPGCLTPRPTNYATEAHRKTDSTIDASASFPEYEASRGAPANAALARAYLSAGMTLTEAACGQYLTDLERISNGVDYGKKQFGLATILATGILAMTSANSDAFTGLALGSAFLLGSADLYRDYALLGPEASEISTLVRRSLEAGRRHNDENPPSNFDEAFRSLMSFSDLCTDVTIHRLVVEAIKSAPVEVDGALTRDVVATIRRELARELGYATPITETQLLGLYWYVIYGDGGDANSGTIDELLGPDLAAKRKALPNLEKVVTLLSSLPGRVKTLLADKIDDQIEDNKKSRVSGKRPTLLPGLQPPGFRLGGNDGRSFTVRVPGAR